MTVVLISNLGKKGAGDFHLVLEDDVKGGYRTVETIAQRDAIPEWARKPGMKVSVIEENFAEYKLGVDTTIAGQVWTLVDRASDTLTQDDLGETVVPLDGDKKINPVYLPNIFLNTVYSVETISEMLALTTFTGNAVIVADTGDGNAATYFKINDNSPSVIEDFIQILFPGSVVSVNGMTGAVTITLQGLLSISENLTAFNNAVLNSPAITSINTTLGGHTNSINGLNQAVSDIINQLDEIIGQIHGSGIVLYEDKEWEAGKYVEYENEGVNGIYRSIQNVPSGIPPSDTDYWILVSSQIQSANSDEATTGQDNKKYLTPKTNLDALINWLGTGLSWNSVGKKINSLFTQSLKNKLDGIQDEATKNATDAQLRDRSTHTGKDPIESIEGAEEADINTVVAKKNDGTYGWVNYSAPKPAGIRKPNGSIIYFDTLQQAMTASYADYEANDYDIFEIYNDIEVDYPIYIGGNRMLNMNGYSIHSTFGGDAIEIDGEFDENRRPKIINGNKISGTTEGVSIKISSFYSGVEIFATIEATEGSGIESASGFALYGNITSKYTSIFSFQEPISIYGNVLSKEGYAIDSAYGNIYGNIITESVDYPAIRTNTLTSKLTVYGSVIIQNELSEAPAILFDDYQPGGAQTIEVQVAGSVLPAQGYAASASSGTVHNLILTFLGMQSYAGSIEETTKPIIVNAKVPFPELGSDGYETPFEVRDALQSLTGADRLDASAIMNLPQGFSGSWNDLTGKPSLFPPAAHTHDISEVSGLLAALSEKVDKEDGYSLLADADQLKIDAINLEGDGTKFFTDDGTYKSELDPRTYIEESASGSVSIDLANKDVIHIEMSGNITSFNVTNPVVGKTYKIYMIQDSIGNRTLTGLDPKFKTENNIPILLTTDGDAVDLLQLDVFSSTDIKVFPVYNI